MKQMVAGGVPIAGVEIGMLMLATQFPRVVGDGGNALTWDFPVHFRVVPDASPQRVVLGAAEGLVDAFISVGRELVETGVSGIAANCGFMVLHQDRLSTALGVPVATSSVLQAAWVKALLAPDRRVGILTISVESLTDAHLGCANVPPGSPIGGVPRDGAFATALLENRTTLDVEAARQEVVGAALALTEAHPDIGALVLECTNMCPYAADVRTAIGLPVYDYVSLVNWFHAGLRPHQFPTHG